MKVLKVLVSVALLLLGGPAPAQPLAMPSPIPTVNIDAIRRISCYGGHAIGTAFVIGPNILATAAHMTDQNDCIDSITGTPLQEYHRDEAHDFALVSSPTYLTRYPIRYSCDRFNDKEQYLSYGNGRGIFSMFILTADKEYTDESFMAGGLGKAKRSVPGMRHLAGAMPGGQSGGPIVDLRGNAHGLNNISDTWFNGYSFEFADTILCKH